MKRSALLLAALLQVLPILRVAVVSSGSTAPPVAAVLTWLAAAAALLGGFEAVSGASAAVTGFVKYSGNTPAGTPTNSAVEPASQAFKYRITVSNPGTDVARNYFDCYPLPPGLTIDTNLGQAGYITGVPTQPGLYPVTLLAGNANYPSPATFPAVITIYPPNTAPVITNPPANLNLLAGSTATFTAGVFGSLPLSAQWLHDSVPIPGKTSLTLVLAHLTAGQGGSYEVVVSNLFGSATSAAALLTVREAFNIDLRISQPDTQPGSPGTRARFVVTGPIQTNYIIWRSLDLKAWAPIQTNHVIDGYLDFVDPDPPAESSFFYRASMASP